MAIYNTAKHTECAEKTVGTRQQIEPVLMVLFGLFVSLGNVPYMQDHMDRIWDHAAGAPSPLPSPPAR